jgi:hypothetical protein
VTQPINPYNQPINLNQQPGASASPQYNGAFQAPQGQSLAANLSAVNPNAGANATGTQLTLENGPGSAGYYNTGYAQANNATNPNTAIDAGTPFGATNEALEAALSPYSNQIGTAYQQAGMYGQLAGASLQQQGPTIGAASTGQLGAQQNLANQQGAAEASLASQYAKIPQTAGAQYQQALGQGINSSLALARSAQGGAVGQAGAMRAAQQQNAQLAGGAAGQSSILSAQEQQAALGGEAAAQSGAASIYGNVGNQSLSAYQTQQGALGQQAQLSQAQQNQNEQFANQLFGQAQNQESFAGNQLNAQTGEQVQGILGNAGVSVNQQNANTNQLSAVAPYVGAGLSLAAALA